MDPVESSNKTGRRLRFYSGVGDRLFVTATGNKLKKQEGDPRRHSAVAKQCQADESRHAILLINLNHYRRDLFVFP